MELNFLISIPKFFFKFDRIYLFIISLLAMMSNLSLYGQLEEISRIVPSHIVQMEKINNQFILIGRSDTYSQNYVPDGMAVLLDKSMMEMEVSFRFREKNGNLTRWIKGEISRLPNSERSIIYIRHEMCQKSVMFYFKVISQVGFPEIFSSGIFLPDLEKYPKGKAVRKQQIADLPKPVIITRSEWGARPSTHGYSTHPYYTKLTLHHAAGFSAEDIDEGKEQLRAIQDLHQFVRGWSDIGYHFVIDKAGNIYQGRPETVIGAHVLGNNTGNIGVCVLGCYHPPELYCGDWLSDETTSALVALYAWISNEYNYNPNILLGHRDYPNNDTSCPGNNVHENLPWFRNEIERYLNLGGPPLEFSISSNYPNPFNNKTKINYQVPSKNHINIIIYDLLGREVKTLINQVQSKGDYKVAWDGVSNLGEAMSSGVYFLRFESDRFSKNNKIILIK
mgnify:CR=1 FL=1|jgi:hypothetical protein